MVNMKRSLFYSFDSAIALFIIISAIMFFSVSSNQNIPLHSTTHMSEDFANSLSVLKMKDANYKSINNIKPSLSERQLESSVLEYIGELWSKNNLTLISTILEDISEDIIKEEIKISFDNEIILKKGDSNNIISSSISKIMTGITNNETIKGISAISYLSGIGNKITSSYTTFGGFVGQGNITKIGSYIPHDSEVINLNFEYSIGSNASFYINNIFCDKLEAPIGLESNINDLTTCSNLLIKGSENLFSIVFDSSSKAYISGGIIEIKYRTSELEEIKLGEKIYKFPGIKGIINLYSSINIPGNISSMNIYLNFKVNSSKINNASLYLKLGNKTIYKINNSKGNNAVNISNSEIVSMFNYNEINTIPLRMGFENLSYNILLEEGNADVILITDLSGSMDRCVNNNNACGSACSGLNCRFDLAKHLGKDFAKELLKVDGNKLGLVTYSDDGSNELSLTNNLSLINSTIDNFVIGGATCICCAIREARLILEEESNESRQKHVIVMTDGISNIRCNQNNLDDTKGCGYFWCGGFYYCGRCPHYVSSCGGCLTYSSTCGDYISDEAKEDAISDSNIIYSNIGAKIETIGFGAAAIGCDYAINSLEDIAEAGNGTAYSSANITGLSEIYSQIAQEIVKSSKTSQLVIIDEGQIETVLYNSSYINITYDYEINNPISSYISITQVSEPFESCDKNLTLPNPQIIDAFVTSYSSNYWTDKVEINSDPIYLLKEFSNNYSELGDPFTITIPPKKLLSSSSNNIKINIGESPTNSTGCSPDSRLIYTIILPTTVSQTGVYKKAEGCNWSIEYNDGTNSNILVPKNYIGNKRCNYTSSSISFDEDDAIDNTIYEFLKILDINNDFDIDIRLDENLFEIETFEINEIPGLWGPAKFKVSVSK